MSLSSNLIKNPGLRVLPPGVERYVIQGCGINIFEIFPDDEIKIVNDEGKQVCEIIVFNSKGKNDLSILSLKENSDGKFIKQAINEDTKISNLLKVRRNQKAFHPNASRHNINLGSNFFSFKRVSIDKNQTIICITNLSSKIQKASLHKSYHSWNNLIGSKIEIRNKHLILKPFETIWLSNK